MPSNANHRFSFEESGTDQTNIGSDRTLCWTVAWITIPLAFFICGYLLGHYQTQTDEHDRAVRFGVGRYYFDNDGNQCFKYGRP